jgi:hypothetical protein
MRYRYIKIPATSALSRLKRVGYCPKMYVTMKREDRNTVISDAYPADKSSIKIRENLTRAIGMRSIKLKERSLYANSSPRRLPRIAKI